MDYKIDGPINLECSHGYRIVVEGFRHHISRTRGSGLLASLLTLKD